MKKLVTLFTVLPGLALAHGNHAPVPEAAHGLAHAVPVLVGAVILAGVGFVIIQRWRS